jgi:L-lactate dehydrogenase complex protein LldG
MSKDAILGAIRRGLKRGPLPADQRAMLDGRLATHPRHLIPARSRVPRPEQVALFIRNVEKEFGTVARVADAAEIPGAIADYLAAQNLAPRFVLAPHPDLAALPWSDKPMLEFEARRAEATDAVSVQHGFAAIAETGTLMLPSDAVRPTTLNILAETEIVVLRTSRIHGAYGKPGTRCGANAPTR